MRAADQYLNRRVNITTTLGSRELAERLSPQTRAQAFFSARVAEARIIDRVRQVSDARSRGELGGGEARVMLKEFLVGSASQTATGPERLTNLASTMRLDLILRQNRLQMEAVGRRAADLEPAVRQRFPYYEYEPSDAVNPRQEHMQYYGIVLPTDDPFWDTHTPPLDYNCQCRLRLLTAEEAEGRIGQARPEKPNNPNGKWIYAGRDGRETVIDRPASGYVFDVKEASTLGELPQLQAPDLIREITDRAQIEFGDQIQFAGNKASYREPQQPYKTFAEHQLPSARQWTDIPFAPALMDAEAALSILKKGIDVTDPGGRKIKLGRALLEHWQIEKAKDPKDIAGRLAHLPLALATVENPRERWDQDTQRIYLQMFSTRAKYRGCMVVVTDDGQARTYFLKNQAAIDKCRKGKSYEQFK